MKDLLKRAGKISSLSLAALVGAYFATSNIQKSDRIIGKTIYGKNYLCTIESLAPYGFDLDKILESSEQTLKFNVLAEIARRDKKGSFEMVYNNRFEIKMKCKKKGVSL